MSLARQLIDKMETLLPQLIERTRITFVDMQVLRGPTGRKRLVDGEVKFESQLKVEQGQARNLRAWLRSSHFTSVDKTARSQAQMRAIRIEKQWCALQLKNVEEVFCEKAQDGAVNFDGALEICKDKSVVSLRHVLH